MAAKELSKEQRIQKEKRRLLKIFANIDGNKKSAVKSLIDQAAFLAVCEADLEAELNKIGWTEEYQNGQNQFGVKKSAAADAYNAVSKQQLAVLKQLLELVPPAERKESRLAALMRE